MKKEMKLRNQKRATNLVCFVSFHFNGASSFFLVFVALCLSYWAHTVCIISISIDCVGVNAIHAGTEHWVPRIRLVFSGEDPRVFVERLQFALRWRENTEALLFYHLSVDCMPIWKGTQSLSCDSLQRIKGYALSAPRLRLKMWVMPFSSCLVWYVLQ